jgi:hypothetical protein
MTSSLIMTELISIMTTQQQSTKHYLQNNIDGKIMFEIFF